jgi:hypothetical protein
MSNRPSGGFAMAITSYLDDFGCRSQNQAGSGPRSGNDPHGLGLADGMHRDRNAGWRHRSGRAAWRRRPRGRLANSPTTTDLRLLCNKSETAKALRGKGIAFNRYDGLAQDEFGIWTVPGGAAKVAWFSDPDDNVLSLTQL